MTTKKEIIEAAGIQFKENGKFLCPDFVIDEEKRELYGLLFLYALRSKKFEESGYDLDRGFLIQSPISGNGKTLAMKVLNRFLIQEKSDLSFWIVTIADLANEWKLYEKEEKVSGARCFDRFEKGNWLIDDLGCKEELFNLWGETVNIGERLIMHVYPKFETGHQKFHLTSNLGFNEILERYDSRACNRLSKMCNTFEHNAKQMRSEAKAVTHTTKKDHSVHDLVKLSDFGNENVRKMIVELMSIFSVKEKIEAPKLVDYKGQWLEQIRELSPKLSETERLQTISNLNIQLEVNGRSVDKESISEAIKILDDAK